MKVEALQEQLQKTFGRKANISLSPQQELKLETSVKHIVDIANHLKKEDPFHFDQLIDCCGVDYLHYGCSQWETDHATSTGFSRGVQSLPSAEPVDDDRYAVIYHLLSVQHNHRLRVKVSVQGDPPMLPSLCDVWSSANWYEREVYDLFGIWFDNHPDLRRILTDYGFIGHPFRKDFPLIGEVAMHYSASERRVVYEPVDIEERTLVPKIIRRDNRYVESDS